MKCYKSILGRCLAGVMVMGCVCTCNTLPVYGMEDNGVAQEEYYDREDIFRGGEAITINGNTWNYMINGSECIINGCTEELGELVIPENINGHEVTAIASGAFSGRTGYTGNLTIPPTVKEIGASAFEGCTGLNGRLLLPPSLDRIGSNAFYGCQFSQIANASICTIPVSTLTVIKRNNYFVNNDQYYYVNDETQEEANQISSGTYTRKEREFKFELSATEARINAKKGDVVQFKYKYKMSGRFDRLYIEIYNPAGEKIGNKNVTFSNGYRGGSASYSVNYPTASLAAGEYKVVGYMGSCETENGEYTLSNEEKAVTILNIAPADDDNKQDDNSDGDDVKVDQIRSFVKRMYQVALGRNPSGEEDNNWVNGLKSGEKKGVDIALGFYTSPELLNKKLSNEDYVELAYAGIMGRDSDEGGKKNWVETLESGVTYTAIVKGFVESQEFMNLCNEYGITPGTLEVTEARDMNVGVTKFVARLYTEALGRGFDVEGLNDWCGQINANPSRDNILNVATNGFFHSQEFLNKNLNNTDFVKVLYRTFLGREYDDAGLSDWVGQLDRGEKTRDQVMEGFAYSPEFGNIMASYGL